MSTNPLLSFASTRIPHLTSTLVLATYAHARHKLTPLGIASGILVATLHSLHPWPQFQHLLLLFFLLGTLATRTGRAAKAHLTHAAAAGGEGPRTSAQVWANSGCACVMVLGHAWLLSQTPFVSGRGGGVRPGVHWPAVQRVLPVGVVAQYAAVAADTFSSELGILAQGQPVLVTRPWVKVPRGTNGGVTVEGLVCGLLGSFLLTGAAGVLLRVLEPRVAMGWGTGVLVVVVGLAGSVIDSVLGATVQATVVDRKSGKVVEGAGGTRVQVVEGGSRVVRGWDLLTNNGVNFAMAALTSVLAMGAAHVLGLGF